MSFSDGYNFQPHSPQTDIALKIGKQPENADSPYPFDGRMGRLIILHILQEKTLQEWEELMKSVVMVSSSSSSSSFGPLEGMKLFLPLDDFPSPNNIPEDNKEPTARDLSKNSFGLVGNYHFRGVGSSSELDHVGSFATGEPFTGSVTAAEQDRRAASVRGAMEHAWSAYERYAWGRDELKPLSKRGHDNWGGMGVTLVDSLDTLWLMGMKDEFWRGRDWVRDHLTFENTGQVSFFETTIRELGGLLAAYDLSGDDTFLTKAKDLGDRLSHAFDTPSGLPKGQVNLHTGSPGGGWTGSNSVLAEIGTVQVEFNYLSEKTGDPKYSKMANKVYDTLVRIDF